MLLTEIEAVVIFILNQGNADQTFCFQRQIFIWCHVAGAKQAQVKLWTLFDANDKCNVTWWEQVLTKPISRFAYRRGGRLFYYLAAEGGELSSAAATCTPSIHSQVPDKICLWLTINAYPLQQCKWLSCSTMMSADKVNFTSKSLKNITLLSFYLSFCSPPLLSNPIVHQGDDGKGGDVGSGSSDDKVGKTLKWTIFKKVLWPRV